MKSRDFSYANVIPTDPVAPWVGGKSQLANVICGIIDKIDHVTYAEPFVGMGGIFFRRTRKPKAEVINDLSKDVTNLFRILNRHFPQFCDVLKWQITSREEFERLKSANPETLTDLERAARFLYLQRLAFGGKVVGQNFGVAVERPARFDLTKLVPDLEAIHTRLTSVVIENMGYADFIPRYDRSSTLFYLDPPYYMSEDYYGPDAFSRDQFPIMANLLRGIKGRFILSLNDHPEVRKIFNKFHIQPVPTRYSVCGSPVKAAELLISNFDLPRLKPSK